MPTVRTSTSAGGWFPFPRGATKSGLSWETLGLLAFLLEKGDGYTIHFDVLTEIGSAGRDKMRGMLKELQDAKYLRRVRTQAADGTFDWEATVYDAPYCSTSQVPLATTQPPPENPSMVEAVPTKTFRESSTTTIDGFSGDIIETLSREESESILSTSYLTLTGSAAASPGTWPKGVNKKQVAALMAAGFTPDTVSAAAPTDLLAIPGIARSTVKVLTGIDVVAQGPSVTTAAQREIMDSYIKTLGYSPQDRKLLVNGGREGSAAKRLAEAGYEAEAVVSCYKYFKAQSFWQSQHLSLTFIASNIAAWISAGRPALPQQGRQNGTGSYQRGGSGGATRPAYTSGLEKLAPDEQAAITAKLRASRGLS